LRRWYVPHHARLTATVQATLSGHPTSVLVDCHSFASVPLPHEDDQEDCRPDICVGTDGFHTPSWLRAAACETAERIGWSVRVDRPFSGALVPVELYRKDARVQAIMIEVNRRLYMDERTGAPLPTFSEVRWRLGELLLRLWSWQSVEPIALLFAATSIYYAFRDAYAEAEAARRESEENDRALRPAYIQRRAALTSR
jgi:N-formylglutamate amidohydrolase